MLNKKKNYYKPVTTIYYKVCETCNKEFTTKNKRKRFCKETHMASHKKAKKIRKRLAKLRGVRIPIWQNRYELYEFIKNCPEGMQVDHIIPLNHPLVSGLHCIKNLQYLTPEDNGRKSNNFDGTLKNDSWRIIKSKK